MKKMKKICICVVLEICEGLWGVFRMNEKLGFYKVLIYIYIYKLICKLSC